MSVEPEKVDTEKGFVTRTEADLKIIEEYAKRQAVFHKAWIKEHPDVAFMLGAALGSLILIVAGWYVFHH